MSVESGTEPGTEPGTGPTSEPTPSQTVGPFFHDALLENDLSELVSPSYPGAIKIVGIVYDGAGEPVTDAMVEISQSRPSSYWETPNRLDGGFSEWGRSGTREGGRYSFSTLKPDPLPGPEGRTQAPYVNVRVFARGLLKPVHTRLYFPDEKEANAADPVLALIGDPRLRDALIARDEGDDLLRFDIYLQGEGQTAFFEFE